MRLRFVTSLLWHDYQPASPVPVAVSAGLVRELRIAIAEAFAGDDLANANGSIVLNIAAN